jgi:FkbM family methyltransferase
MALVSLLEADMFGRRRYADFFGSGLFQRLAEHGLVCVGEMDPSRPRQCYCRTSQFLIALFAPRDLDVIFSIWGSNAYKVNPVRASVALEIGTFRGHGALWCAENPLIEKIYTYEAFPEWGEQAEKNIADNALEDKIFLTKKAVLDFNGETEGLCDCVFGDLSTIRTESAGRIRSFMHQNYSLNEQAKAVSVEVVDIAAEIGAIFEKHPDRDLILKLGAVGSEYPIIRRLAETGYLEKVTSVTGLYYDAPRDLAEQMGKCGLKAEFAISPAHQQTLGSFCGRFYARRD